MQIVCANCRKTLEYSGDRPRFCAYCAAPFEESDPRLAVTLGSPVEVGQRFAPHREGETIADYRLTRKLGEGGMGVVWEAEQAESGRRVALKLLSSNVRRSDETLERFLREGRSAASLSHPRSTFVFDAGEDQGQPYIAMELMTGKNLGDVVAERGPLEPRIAVDCILDAIDGLAAAHSLGVLHRDVKPSNCFLDSAGRVKLGDFGLSKVLEDESTVTRTGSFLGTPQFAAPEQLRGAEIDERADVYSMAATLYFLVAGKAPFTGDAAAVISRVSSEEAPPLISIAPSASRELSRVLAQALARDPEKRYPSLTEFRQALAPFATGGTTVADLGRRFAAYMIDSILVEVLAVVMGVVFSAVMATLGALLLGDFAQAGALGMIFTTLPQLAAVALKILYFALAEGRWGCGVGKRMMGLRVRTLAGESPGTLRSLARAAFVPGGLGLAFAPAIFAGWVFRPGVEQPMSSSLNTTSILLALVFEHVARMAITACLFTMRARNGFRGLHEFATGTRVVRLQGDATVSRGLPIAGPLAVAAPVSRGAYQVIGKIGAEGRQETWAGVDPSLDRRVWIVESPDENEGPSDTRRAVTRPTRGFWLRGGRTDQGSWDAYDAVQGAPLAAVFSANPQTSWEESRNWLLELAEELVAASKDGTYHGPPDPSRVWITVAGGLKLLDVPSGFATRSPEPSIDATESATRLLREVVALATRPESTPLHAREFAQSLASRPATISTLAWAAAELHGMRIRPARLDWEIRLGLLGVAFGTEFILYSLVAQLVALAAFSFTNASNPAASAWVVATATLLPAVLGFWLKGGPTFRFMRIAVLRRDRLASRGRCAWRSFLAWAPATLLNSASACMLMLTLRSFAQKRPSPSATVGDAFAALLIFFVLLLAGTILAGGSFYAIVRPRRGLQDILAGVTLVPK